MQHSGSVKSNVLVVYRKAAIGLAGTGQPTNPGRPTNFQLVEFSPLEYPLSGVALSLCSPWNPHFDVPVRQK